MCPDRQILSVYLDGELPSPWKEEMEAHLIRCPECRAKLERYRRLSAFIAGDRRDLSAERERVWLKLGKAVSGTRCGGPGARYFWRQSVAVPLPAVIAAAALLVAAFTLAITNYTAKKTAPAVDTVAAAGISLDVQEIMPVAADMNSFLRYLESEDSADFMIIRLPETRSFSNSGQPTIVKVSDYLRSGPSQ
ncbi:MAG: zf-HC2 domain-containing protein [Spirochaetaceae bacterium]|jgi:anti-sigma factor RsiW|nr:zf-HC2 domain-containing protein [Spirochaetaceae bacterium]